MSRSLATLICVLAVVLAGPAAAHEWVDWFERGDAHLSPRGYATARSVADWVERDRANAEVVIVAHLDSIEARENVGLDRRRAFAMMSELLTLGVAPDMMRVELKSASQLARAGDGTDALNRRVTVAVNFLAPGRPPKLSHYDQPRLFFDEGEVTLDEFDELTLRQALSYYRPGLFRLVINAYDDTAGTQLSSQSVSEQRAEETARALVRLGARWDDIERTAHGETRLARATSDGVSEPLNRFTTVNVWRRTPAR